MASIASVRSMNTKTAYILLSCIWKFEISSMSLVVARGWPGRPVDPSVDVQNICRGQVKQPFKI